MGKKIVEAHKETRALRESVVVPTHVERSESSEFRAAKKRLQQDGHFQCWVCGATENLEVHHFAAEWSLADCVDFEKLKRFCEEWDVYGYGKLLYKKPIKTVDDIRNLMVLCEDHHIGVNPDNRKCGTGIHSLSFPMFVIQKIAKDEYNPIPQQGCSADELLERREQK